ncbi:MAG: hypothetical protein PHU85_11445 [Phycisphaerae bacterium]|nr:hypothetical protein [Phycisphaerae bacterium]
MDTGSEFTWIPAKTLEQIGVKREKKDEAFVMANGGQITRSVGFAIVRVGQHFTIDEIVFAEEGDLSLLGARTLEGLNLAVDPRKKRLVSAGPFPAAAAIARVSRTDRAGTISKRELWLATNNEAMSVVRRGLQESREGKIAKAPDLDAALLGTPARRGSRSR